MKPRLTELCRSQKDVEKETSDHLEAMMSATIDRCPKWSADFQSRIGKAETFQNCLSCNARVTPPLIAPGCHVKIA